MERWVFENLGGIVCPSDNDHRGVGAWLYGIGRALTLARSTAGRPMHSSVPQVKHWGEDTGIVPSGQTLGGHRYSTLRSNIGGTRV